MIILKWDILVLKKSAQCRVFAAYPREQSFCCPCDISLRFSAPPLSQLCSRRQLPDKDVLELSDIWKQDMTIYIMPKNICLVTTRTIYLITMIARPNCFDLY